MQAYSTEQSQDCTPSSKAFSLSKQLKKIEQKCDFMFWGFNSLSSGTALDKVGRVKTGYVNSLSKQIKCVPTDTF